MRLRERWRLIDLEQNSPIWNMAIDEAIFKAHILEKIPHTVRFYCWKPSAVSIGKHQSMEDECDLEAVKDLGVDVIRRFTGGGAVFHDRKREITYSIITSLKEEDDTFKTVEDSYYFLAQGLIEALNILGLSSDIRAIHCPSFFVNGRKISGNAQYRKKGHVLQHGTLLLDYDPSLMYSVLKDPRGRAPSKMVQSVYQKITTLTKELNREVSLEEVYEALKGGFSKSLKEQLVPEDLSDWEKTKAAEIVKNKINSPFWCRIA